jgi:hypothetical protein
MSSPGKTHETLSEIYLKANGIGSMDHVIGYLLSKCKALTSIFLYCHIIIITIVITRKNNTKSFYDTQDV